MAMTAIAPAGSPGSQEAPQAPPAGSAGVGPGGAAYGSPRLLPMQTGRGPGGQVRGRDELSSYQNAVNGDDVDVSAKSTLAVEFYRAGNCYRFFVSQPLFAASRTSAARRGRHAVL